MGETNLYVAIIAGLTLIGTIFNAWINWKRDARNREWLMEDQKRSMELLQRHAEIKAKLDENTQLTLATRDDAKIAYKEANDVNKKLADSQKLTVEAVRTVAEVLKPRSATERTRSTDG